MIQQPVTLSERTRQMLSGLTTRIGAAVYRAGIHPDLITVAGLVVVGIGAVLIAFGHLQWGALVLILGLPLDAVDGAVARAMQRKDKFGAVLDSTLDRYADGFIFGSLSYYFAVQDRFDLALAALATLMGSFVVSYVRARAGEADLSVKVGLFDRFVRVVVIVTALLLPPLLPLGLWLLAVGTNATGLQRLWYVYTTLKNREV